MITPTHENNLDKNNNAGENGAGAGAGIPGTPPAEAQPGQQPPPPPVKRGPGRPRKLGLSRPPGTAPAATEPAGHIVAALWTKENCRPIGQLPFFAAGVATGFKGWQLEEKEIEMLAEPLAQVLNLLVPAGGKYAALTALTSTLLVIAGAKYNDYGAYLDKKKKEDVSLSG